MSFHVVLDYIEAVIFGVMMLVCWREKSMTSALSAGLLIVFLELASLHA